MSFASLLASTLSEDNVAGTLGLYDAASGRPFIDRVTFVNAGSAAARAGIRAGMLIDMRALSSATRYRWYAGTSYGVFTRGERVHVPVLRGTTIRSVTVVAQPFRQRWDIWLYNAGAVWQLLFAVLLAWRRPESWEARVLCLWFIIGIIWVNLNGGNLVLPSLAVQVPLNVLAVLAATVTSPLLAVYAMLFARPASRVRRALAVLSYLSALVVCGYTLTSLAASWSAFADPLGRALNNVFLSGLVALTNVFPLLCAFAAIAAARGADRGRIAWTTLTVGLTYAVSSLWFLTAWPLFSSGPGLRALFIMGNTASFLAPLGMTYALLSRRLLDVGFVLNRAAIFAGVSFVLVGLFVLVEWLLSGWLQTASHSANIIVSAVLALVLGLSIRFVHARVEHVVDSVLFRKRREDEEAIRRLAREAPYITEGDVLLDRVTTVLSTHADAAFVRVLLDDGAGAYGGVSENDPALVSLRAKHDVVDLHTLETRVEGEFAYPMVTRGRLVGALVLGPKRSGESYAPDESDAIAQLARDAGAALDVLEAKKGQTDDPLREDVRAMCELLKALPEQMADALERRARLV